MKPFRFHPEAEIEMINAAAYYEARQSRRVGVEKRNPPHKYTPSFAPSRPPEPNEIIPDARGGAFHIRSTHPTLCGGEQDRKPMSWAIKTHRLFRSVSLNFRIS